LAIALLLIAGAAMIARWRNKEIFSSNRKGLYVGGYLISSSLTLVLAFLGGVILYGF
jgi:hypothetical protein